MSGQLTVMTILVAIVPLLCLGTLLYVFYDVSYQEKTSVHLGEQVLRNAQSIDAFLDEKLSNLRQEAGTSTLEDLSNPHLLRERLHSMQNAYQGVFTDLNLVDSSGNIVARAGTSTSLGEKSMEAWFPQAINRPFLSAISPPAGRNSFERTHHCAAATLAAAGAPRSAPD